jgi:hypothetical protein
MILTMTFSITGRIPDGENLTALFLEETLEEALVSFIDYLYGNDHDEREQKTKSHGTCVYIESVVEAPQEALTQHYTSFRGAITDTAQETIKRLRAKHYW